MATVLLTYEFGAGLGHLNRLIAVGKRLAGANRLVFALPDVGLGEPLVRRALGDGVEIRVGVVWPAPTSPEARHVPTHTFADVIRLFRFDEVDRLLAACRRWTELLREISPRLIIADFAPTLRLSAMDRIPTVVVGNGYTVPPAGRPLPLLRPWETRAPPVSRANEGRLLSAVNEVRAKLSGPAVDSFADLFQGESTFVCTIAEFDPYRASRDAPALWPFNIPAMPRGRAFRDRTGAAVFCYLPGSHPALRPVLEALSGLDRRTEVYIQGADPRQVAGRCSPTVAIHTKPADFSKVLPEASLLLHHAGLGTAYAGLAAGVPQLVMPLNLEHLITTRGLEGFEVATRLPTAPAPDAGSLRRACNTLLGDAARQAAALKAAEDLEMRREADPVGRVVAACNAML